MPCKLNPDAPEFIPTCCLSTMCGMEFGGEDLTEDNITQEELDEIEMAEDWVATQVYIEELEREHLIELALR